MSNVLEYILKLNDMLTPGMRQAARISETSANKISSEFDKISNKGKSMGASINELRKRLEAVNQVRFSTHLTREFDIATKAAIKLERQIDKLENKGKSNSGGGIGSLISTAAIIYGAQDILASGIKQKQISGAINFATGGMGAEATSRVRNINDKYGLSNEAGMEGFKTIAGGTRNLGYSLNDQVNIYKGVGAGVAAMGLTAEQAKLSFLALGQMASKGKVSAEELRGQLGEQIPGALGIAARALGVTQSKLNDMLQQGEIMSKDFLPKFAAQMQKEFGEAAANMADSPQAKLNRLSNAILDVKMAFTDHLLPAVQPIIDMLSQAAIWFAKNSDIMVPLAVGISGVVLAFNLWTLGSNLLNISLMANPVLLIISGVILLASVVWGLYQKFGWFRGAVYATWEAVKGFAFLIKDYVIDRLKGMLSGLTGIGQALWKFINGDWKGAWEVGKQAVKDLVGVDAFKNAASNFKSIGKNAATAYNKGVQEVESQKKKKGVNPTTYGNTTGGESTTTIDSGKSKSDSVNNGGQRSIQISIGKQIEKMEIHVMSAQEGAAEIETAVREAIRRVLYNINAVSAG